MFLPNSITKVFFVIIGIMITGHIKGQEVIPFELYFNNFKTINPAAAGIFDEQKFDIQFRANNTQVDFHPSFALISYENQLTSLNSGIGLILENRQAGISTRVTGKALYNYQFAFDDQTLVIGTGIGLISDSYDLYLYKVIDPDDPILIERSSTTTAFDLDFGIAYIWQNTQAGISIRNVLESEIHDNEFSRLNRTNIQFLNAYVNHSFKVSNVVINPSLYLQTDYDNVLADLNTLFEIRDLLLIGGSYRVTEGNNFLNLNGGIKWKNNIRLMGILYSSGYEGPGNNYEFSLSIAIENK
nr:PorP/SprF family type IX secretion system membrane protein [Fulvivirga sp. M361]